MSDHDEPAADEAAFDGPDFDDPAFDDLRGLLADARVTEPVPADVAARLDATLGALREERRAEAHVATVVPLRRRVGRVLVAAAAVVAVGSAGFGIFQNAPDDSGNADTAASRAEDQAEGGSASPSAPENAPAPSTTSQKGLGAPPQLTTAHFSRDVTRTMRSLTVERVTGSTAGGDNTHDGATGDPDQPTPYARGEAPPVTATPPEPDSAAVEGELDSCAGPEAPDAVTLPATLDGAPVALVFRPPTADAQVVEAWSCDGDTLLASASVPH